MGFVVVSRLAKSESSCAAREGVVHTSHDPFGGIGMARALLETQDQWQKLG